MLVPEHFFHKLFYAPFFLLSVENNRVSVIGVVLVDLPFGEVKKWRQKSLSRFLRFKKQYVLGPNLDVELSKNKEFGKTIAFKPGE